MLVIGNEILTGKVEEKNARYASAELFRLGVRLRRIVVIPDEVDVIADSVKELAADHDIVFTSGGVGPTHDDVTVQGIAQAVGRKLVRNAEMEQSLREVYGTHVNEHVLRMADLPEGTELFLGEGLRVPVLIVENIYIFPGIPELFRAKLDALRDRFADQPFRLETLYVKLDESQLAASLHDVLEAHPTVDIGSYPVWNNPHYRVRITLESKDAAEVVAALELLKSLLPADRIVPPPSEPDA